MNCAGCRSELVAYLEEDLGAAERAELEIHLAGCASCRTALEAERGLSVMLHSLPAVEPPPSFEARFWARIAREQAETGGWLRRLFSHRLGLGLGGAAAVALAAFLALRDRSAPEVDWQIIANAEDLELLADPDLELIEVVDKLEAAERDPG